MKTIYKYNYDPSTLKGRRFYQPDKFEENEPSDDDLFECWDWYLQSTIWQWYQVRHDLIDYTLDDLQRAYNDFEYIEPWNEYMEHWRN